MVEKVKSKEKDGTDLKVIADTLHEKSCRDPFECKYDDESWDDPGYNKKKWLKKAKVLQKFAKTYSIDPLALLDLIKK